MKGILVFADGRVSSLDHQDACEWFILHGGVTEGPMAQARYFRLADSARLHPSDHDGCGGDECLVFTERAEVDYRATRRF